MSLLQLLSLVAMLLLLQLKSTSGNANISVVEKGTPGVIVYNVSQVCPELENQPPTRGTVLPISNQRTFYTYFDASNILVLRLNCCVQLDRDQIAMDLGNTIQPVVYTVSYLVLSTLKNCIINLNVVDIDDHIPTFNRSAVNLSIPEGPSSTVSWPMDLAVDNDEGENSIQNYYISSVDPVVSATFYLNISRDSNRKIVSVQLVRNTTINRKQTPSFSFVIVAEEGRPNTPKGYQNVFINVEFACLTAPVFEMPSYQIQVPENTSINTVVLTVKAIPQDPSKNAALVYDLISQCTISAPGRPCVNGFVGFSVDRASGNLTLIQKLDYATMQQITITVRATDSCNFTGYAQVQVMVVFVNDKPPVIRFGSSTSTITIPEDLAVKSDVIPLTISSFVNFTALVIDNSTGLVSDTFYLANFFESSYRVKLLQPLNSRIRSSYNITIKATDAGNNVAYSTVSIIVLGVNHPPVFDNKTALVTVFDNTRNGTVILRVRASDGDVGGNGVITYELPPPNATYLYQNNFTVNSISGDVLINGVLSSKVVSSFLLLLKARDNPTDGGPYLTDYMVVNITLLEASIRRPIFLPQPSQMNISENVLVGSVIFQAVAAANGTLITYGLMSNPLFQIDSASGIISIAGSLNGSANKQYVLNITAYNGFPPPSFSILTINILPGDTTGPVFVPKSYNAQVMRTAAIGSRVVDVKAVDTYSSVLLYEIVDGNGEGKFILNPTNGTITVSKPLDQSAAQTYVLHVKASDRTYYSKWLAEVMISLQDLVFVNTPYYFQVQEGLPAGTIVGSVSVLPSYPGQVQFYIANGSEDLSIDANSGLITTKRPLVSANGNVYSVRIQAVFTPGNQGILGTTVFQDVSIFVVQRQSLYNVTVRRSLDVGATVLNISTDGSSGGITTYSLSSSSSIPFQVDRSTGSVYVTNYLDYVPKHTYTFGVVATHYTSPQVQQFITITVNVDLAILFDSPLYNFTISQTATEGSVVGIIRATGRRIADVYYAFSDGQDNIYFLLNKTTGQISLRVDASRLPAQYSLNVIARDSQDPTLWSTVMVSFAHFESSFSTSTPLGTITSIVIIVAIIVGVLLVLALVLTVALLTLRKKKHYDPKVSDRQGTHHPNSGCEMQTFEGGADPAILTSVKPTESYPEPPSCRETVEVDHPKSNAMPKDAPVYKTDSLSRLPKHIRSTSDLASTVATEMLSGLEDTGPYTKAQLMAIYAANAQLLQDDGSQDSVQMFGSEGGVEADDQEVDIDHMLYAKAIGFEDDQCTSEVTNDRDVAKDERSMCSSGLDSRTRGEREQPRYHFTDKEWLPAVTSVTDTIEELVVEDPRFSHDRLNYPLSQAVSLYSEGGSQSLLMRSQPAPHQYYRGGGYMPRSLHESGYFNEHDHRSQQGQVRPSKHRPPPDHQYELYPRSNSAAYLPPGVHSRYNSTTAIPHPNPLSIPISAPQSTGPQRKRPQDPQPPNLRPSHTPSSNTPTDDGLMETVQPNRALPYYSSISSLTSTNLSQPGPRDHVLY